MCGSGGSARRPSRPFAPTCGSGGRDRKFPRTSWPRTPRRTRSAWSAHPDGMDLGMADFQLVAPYEPAGDQPQAIEQLVEGLRTGQAHQTLLGVTGSGKTYTMANV